MASAYISLDKHTYSRNDPTYVMETTLEAYTLADKRHTDTWEIHKTLTAATAEGTPMCAPAAYVITGRLGETNAPAAEYKFCDIEDLRERGNPCPSFCVRDKYHFALNMSKHWQVNPDAQICQEYPIHLGLTNFFWWHTRPGTHTHQTKYHLFFDSLTNEHFTDPIPLHRRPGGDSLRGCHPAAAALLPR